MIDSPPDEDRRLLCDDLSLPEGPLRLDDGTWLVVELDPRRGTVTQVLDDGSRVEHAKTGRPNGLAMTADGAVWVAESLNPGVFRLELGGEISRELSEVEGEALLWPNDLCVGPEGALYITDSGLLVEDLLSDVVANEVREDWADVCVDGKLIRFDPRSGEARILERGIQFTNGIAFGPDGLLYVNETFSGDIFRYRIEDGAVAGEREVFGNVRDPEYRESGMRGPDGMAFSTDGRLWVTVFGQGDITVLEPDGSVQRRIPLPGRSPTNVAFGGDGRIYVVEGEKGTLESRYVGVDGLPLFS
jgi:gluconolactonase